ncbi:MAG: polymer-forming cytoskeletal protein [Chloroflexi bacterium]|nr:polymer-forming cytoskeletal protein [Chloroflexota bacterium]
MRKRGLWLIILALSFMYLLVPGAVYAQGPVKSGDRVVFGSSTTIRSGERVDGDVVVFGGSLKIEEGAVVHGDTVVFGGSAEIAGRVEGDLVTMGGSSHLARTGAVLGDIFTLGGSVQRDEGSQLGGKEVEGLPNDVQRIFPKAPVAPQSPAVPVIPAIPNRPRIPVGRESTNPVLGFLFWIFRTFVTALAMVALGILAMLLFPVQTNRITETARGEPIPSIGFGLLTAIAGPMLTALLVLTCIGIPVALVLAVGLGVAGLWGFLSIGILLGERLYRSINPEPRSHLAPAVIGILLLTVLHSIPVLNVLVGTVAVLWGIGAVVLTRFGTQPYPLATSVTRPLTPSPAAQTPVV